jgi:glucose/arabinose dehydrogenase
MTRIQKSLFGIGMFLVVFLGLGFWLLSGQTAQYTEAQVTGLKPKLAYPDAQTIPTIRVADPVGWKAGEAPVPAQGLTVTRFADGLNHPRTLTVLPNGDVLAAETNSPGGHGGSGISGMVERWLMKKAGAGGASPNVIVLLRDANGDGVAEQRFEMRNPALNSPYGMVFRDDHLIVANNNAVLSFPYKLGDTQLTGKPEKLMDLPAGGEHWARNAILSPDGTKLYVTVGSSTNIADNGIAAEEGRAAIHEYDFATKSSRIYAQGLRNPNGLDWNPASGELWTVVNERDMLGSDLVPDYLTNVPIGAHYGWPWIYWKNNVDARVNAPLPIYINDYVRKPEYALGAHVAPLGLAFARGGHRLGAQFANGAFIANHGSWNRKPMSGYDVVFVGFDARGNVLPGQPIKVLTGFLNQDQKTTRGRPVWVAFAHDGALLVSDDTGGVIWRVIAPGAAPSAAIAPVSSGRVLKAPGTVSNLVATPDQDSSLMQPKP